MSALLARQGWNVCVHERSENPREIGAGIYLKENSLRYLDRVGISDEILQAGTRLRRSEIRDHRGRRLLTRDISRERVVVVPRTTLHELLRRAAVDAGVTLNTSARVTAVRPDGSLTVEDGGQFHGDLLVGADGHASIVRTSMSLGGSSRVLPFGSTRVLVRRASDDATDGSTEYWCGRLRVMVVPCGDGVTYFAAGSPEKDPGSSLPFPVEYWSRQFPHLASLFERVEDKAPHRDAHVYVETRGWVKGQCAIIGDAATCQPPNLGQGAGLAIANAGRLADSLEGIPLSSIARRLMDWEQTYRRDSLQIQRWSRRWDYVAHRWPSWLQDVRSGLVAGMGHFPPTSQRWGDLYRGGPTERSIAAYR